MRLMPRLPLFYAFAYLRQYAMRFDADAAICRRSMPPPII